MPSYSGTTTSSSGTLTLDITPNDVITFTPTGTYTVEYPLGTVAISAATTAQTLTGTTSAAQMRLLCSSGSVVYSCVDGADETKTLTPAAAATVQALVSPDGNFRIGWDFTAQINRQRQFESFNKLADWTYTAASPVNASIVEAAGRGPYSSTALRFSASTTGGQNASITKDIKFNWNTVTGVWLVTDVHFRQTAATLAMTLYTSTAVALGAGTGRWTLANPVSSLAVSLQPTWVPKASWTVLDGSPSWANDQLSWRARIDSGGEQRDWSLMGMFAGGARPTVIITQDDGWDTSYTIAYPACRKRGIPQTHYLIPELIGGGSNITLAQAREMRASGDYLGLHGNERWDLNPSKIAVDVAGLRAVGIDTTHAAYPEGRIGDGTTWLATEAALTAQGVKTARIAGGASPTLRFVGDPLALTSYPLNNSMSLAQATAVVDTAIASGGTVIFYGHKYGAVADSLTWVTADFTALLDYIYQKRLEGSLDVTTIDKWWQGQTP